ncbi:XrtA/PEP-CTERM system histidine kinase PrsK [Altererythrobacter sp. TH136]|uniref:XrtA/PEP-CTERM system histidine kinase PrsK n=1 Tax=Altererythrobacter sp. TH136 TaxID=2067415 RepID=UPI0011644CD0|nr:XrtA/PEP-CTERM system histidine kinase PrsK [Altererythrobacter sp. TH136]QDM39832.1 PEP-CTERM system histidine kinase PrsK [Altererythrobacter sp. TH136]
MAHVWIVAGFFLSLAAAVSCTLVAAFLWRKQSQRRERGATIAALAITALWCVTHAAWGPQATAANLLESARNVAWIIVLYRLFGNDGRDHSLGPIRPLVIALCLVELLQVGVVILDARFGSQAQVHSVTLSVTALLRALVAVGALVLVHNLYAGASAVSRQVIRWAAAALALMWGYQLNLYTVAWFARTMPAEMVALRGLVPVIMAVLLAIGANARAADLKLSASRTVAFQTLSLILIGGYLLVMLLLSQSLSLLGGDFARLTQVAFLFAAATGALLWLPSAKLRGWLRVKTYKHLFQHRYDYRAEWLRFTGTIGRAGPEAPALPDRAAQALADITDSQGAVLLLPAEDGRFQLAGRWQWPEVTVPAKACSPELVATLERAGKVVELDEVRAGAGSSGEQSEVPPWMCHDQRAWAVVPLLHFDRLIGIALLARPPVARRLDWEDFDLLKVVGRQLASYLAEQAGHEALMEAAQFDEFNRRIAFVMHDIKNLASQLSLLSRNAQRHADNPEFRQDMLVTLTKSAEKLDALLARLGRYGASGSASRQSVDLTALARRVASRCAALHPVDLTRADQCTVLADPEGLEQALVHLVQNAIDASPPGVPVYLDVSCDGLQGRIEIVDSGTGMSPRFLRESLFKPFVSSKNGGFGIGAFEARELVRAMGGRLDVESREGLGTRFSIALPLSAAAGYLEQNFESEAA